MIDLLTTTILAVTACVVQYACLTENDLLVEGKDARLQKARGRTQEAIRAGTAAP